MVLAASLTAVGKPAPPTPTRPQARMAASRLSLSVTAGGVQAGSTVWLPSVLMATALQTAPLTMRMGATSSTVPDTLECTSALTKPPALPMSVPTMTVSPFLTTGSAGAPMCICIGMTTCWGTGICTVAMPAVAFSCGTRAPLAERLSPFSIEVSSPDFYGLPRQTTAADLPNHIDYIVTFLRNKSTAAAGQGAHKNTVQFQRYAQDCKRVAAVRGGT